MNETVRAFLICICFCALGFGMGVGWHSFESYDVPDGAEYKLLRCETHKGKLEMKLSRCETDCARCSGQWEPSASCQVTLRSNRTSSPGPAREAPRSPRPLVVRPGRVSAR